MVRRSMPAGIPGGADSTLTICIGPPQTGHNLTTGRTPSSPVTLALCIGPHRAFWSQGHLFVAAFLAGVFHPALAELRFDAIGRTASPLVPALIVAAGWRYVEFFTANIRNPNTRRTYARACSRFFAWCEVRGLTLTTILGAAAS
jgi:hypothetical protein